jgi:signal transduction histidine kinase
LENILHILHLEDSPIDAELIRNIIDDQWKDSVIEVVESEIDFRAAIVRNRFSLILADNYLPGLMGIEALEIARQSHPDTPFIFVSGTMGEEIAIEMLKKGAVDYVLKCNLSRLVPSIERALKDSAELAQRKQIEHDLKQKNQEIEQFIYTVSHDLRSPLVTIKSFLGYLEQDITAGDRENISKDMHFISTATSKMEVLLNELLEVSRVGRVRSNPIWISLSSLFKEVVDENAASILARNVDIRMNGGDLNLYGDHQ